MIEKSIPKDVLARVRSLGARHGIVPTLARLVYLSSNKITPALIMKGLILSPDHVNPQFLGEADGHWRFLERDELEYFGGADHKLELEQGFVAEAIAQGHRCYGLVTNNTLASYAWYSTRPTPIDMNTLPNLMGHFDPSYVYAYKGYTAPAFRGTHLLGKGLARALQAYTATGIDGIVSFVEITNYAALKSHYRLGSRPFGTVLILKVGGHYFTHVTSGCRPYGIQFIRSHNE